MIYRVKLEKISIGNFKEYGAYFSEQGIDPTFSGSYFDWWNEVGLADIGGRISFGVVKPKSNPELSERVFEQHRKTPEVLVPIDNDVIILVGKREAFENNPIREEDFGAFIVPRGTVVSLNPGVWHHAPMIEKGTARVLVIFREGTSVYDNTVVDLSTAGDVVQVV